jgi:uncharacterized membrane protein YkvA (DUF1232 family)
MGEERQKKIPPAKRSKVFEEISLRMKLILRLLMDSRVHPLLKLLPLAPLIYLLVPDLLPGPIDDAIVLWLGSQLFVELCPPEVVREHMNALNSVIEGEWREIDE